MRPLIKSLLLSSTFVGLGLGGIVTASASNYSARRANSVRLVWRHHMGRHAYHTVKGARYSKHLGVKYSTNNDLPGVTWYTDAHEKLYNKKKHTAAIYYHVKSGDGQHGGWIWRGYLTAGIASQQSDSYTVTKTDSSDDIVKKMLQYLGGNAKLNPQSTIMANEILTRSMNGHYTFMTPKQLKKDTYAEGTSYPVGSYYGGKDMSKGQEDQNDVTFSKLLSDSHVASRDRYFNINYYVQNKNDIGYLLGKYYAPETDFFGKRGLTRENYFESVKIGVAVAKLSSDMYAVVVIFHYPKKFWGLVVDD